MLEGQTYDAVCNNFRWKIPATYNIGVDICDEWAVTVPNGYRSYMSVLMKKSTDIPSRTSWPGQTSWLMP